MNRPKNLVKRGEIYHARFQIKGKLIRKSLETTDLAVAKERLAALRLACKAEAEAEKWAAKPLQAHDASRPGTVEEPQKLEDKQATDNRDSQKDCSWEELRRLALQKIATETCPTQVADHRRSLNKFALLCGATRASDVNQNNLLTFTSLRLAGDPKLKEPPVSRKTVNKQVGHILQAMRAGAEHDLHRVAIPKFKKLRHTAGKERRTLTVDEIQALLDATERPQERLLWLTALKTGMRKGELVALTWKHIQGNSIVLRADQTKSRKKRVIPIADGLLQELLANKEHPEYVFVNRAGNPWRNNLLTRFYVRCKEAGIRDAEPGGSVDIHSLRVTFVTQAIESGVDPKTVQVIVGHSTLELTMNVYARARNENLVTAVNSLPY